MAGVLAAAGVSDAEGVVRSAARPLLRHPTQTLVVVQVSEAVALGFAGERGGVASDRSGSAAAVDGELLTERGIKTGNGAAEAILALYRSRGEGLEPPEGSYAAAVWDAERRALVLLTDRLGRRPLYLTRRNGATLVAGELKALVAAGVRPELDLEAWSEILAYEHPLGDHAPLSGVRLVPAGSTLTLAPEGETLRERWRYRLEPAEAGDERELVEELGRLLAAGVERRLGADAALALSGGLDSRCLAALASEAPPRPVAVTYGAPRSGDLVIGTEVAARTGLEHRPLVLEPGYIARGAAETVWLAEAQVRCFHAHHLALRGFREDAGVTVLAIGFGGDIVLRGSNPVAPFSSEEDFLEQRHRSAANCLTDELLEELLAPDFAAALRGRARESFARCLGEEEGDPVSRKNQFAFRHVLRRMQWPGAELFADELAPRDPFDDLELVDFCRRLPHSLRRGGRLQAAFLRRYPALASLPSEKLGISPSLTGLRARAASRRAWAAERARATAARAFGPGRVPDRRGLGDYVTDLRATGEALLSVLLEPRTLARGQLREEPIRRLVAETLAGRVRHTYVLGVLLTLELFQRQFLEGDRPADP